MLKGSVFQFRYRQPARRSIGEFPTHRYVASVLLQNVLPYTEEYQLSIERQLSTGTLLTVSYVGTQGHHLLSSLQANPGNPALCLSVHDDSQVVGGANGNHCGPGGETEYISDHGGTINSTRVLSAQASAVMATSSPAECPATTHCS